MVMRIAEWTTVRKEFSILKLENILHNWEVCMVSVLGKRGRQLFGGVLQMETLKFNVDDITRGKPV